ncbi:UDP-glycosyltransferase 73C6 [Hordeum vulgare]|nr:UDP-glycosyltransferase 73C6 [Hordeum vulgare]
MARNQDTAVEERKVALEERKVGMEERSRLLDSEKYLFFMDTSILNEAQKEYDNLAREEVLIQKRAMIRDMGGGGIGQLSLPQTMSLLRCDSLLTLVALALSFLALSVFAMGCLGLESRRHNTL